MCKENQPTNIKTYILTQISWRVSAILWKKKFLTFYWIYTLLLLGCTVYLPIAVGAGHGRLAPMGHEDPVPVWSTRVEFTLKNYVDTMIYEMKLPSFLCKNCTFELSSQHIHACIDWLTHYIHGIRQRPRRASPAAAPVVVYGWPAAHSRSASARAQYNNPR